MFEDPSTLIILAILAASIFFKLSSLLGNQEYSNLEIIKNMDKDKLINLEDFLDLGEYEKFAKEIIIIQDNSNNFSIKKFIANAEKAFEAIVVAYNSKDKEVLKSLLSKDLYENFEKYIDNQTEKKKVEIIYLKSEIKNIKLDKKLAKIEMEFTSEKNDNEGVIIDNWVFSKDLLNQSPVWLLTSTKGIKE